MNVFIKAHMGDCTTDKLQSYLLKLQEMENELKKKDINATINVEVENN